MQIGQFVVACLPSWPAIGLGGPVLLLWSAGCLWSAARLKRRWHLKTGYSRKIFHLLTFASAGVLHLAGGLSLVCLFGAMTTAVLAYTVSRGNGHPFYEALAREDDAPYRTHYIVISYVATLIGGLLSNLAAGPFAVFGYLVCGLGDAAGEPIGTRWGRHRYAVPSRGGINATRSLEGSTGVFIVSVLASFAGVAAFADFAQAVSAWPIVVAISAACTVVEAVSPHGWDNATLQVTPSLLFAYLLGSAFPPPYHGGG